MTVSRDYLKDREMTPESWVKPYKSAFPEWPGILRVPQDGENGGAGTRHHGCFGFGLLKEELLELGEEAMFFKNRSFQIIEEGLTSGLRRGVRDAGDLG